MAEIVASQRDLADIFGVSTRTVQRWDADGLHESRVPGEGAMYRVGPAVRWRIREVEGAANQPLAEARLRRARVEAERRELELAERAGQLLPVDAFRRALRENHVVVRRNLQALPGSVAPELVGLEQPRDAEAVLVAAVDRVLRGMIRGAEALAKGEASPLVELDELAEVPGIGPATLARIREHLGDRG